MSRISRRTALFGAVAALLAPAASATAATVPPPPPSRFIPTPIPGSTPTFTSGQSKGLSATVVCYASQDATAVSLVMQNTSGVDKTVTVAHSDTGRSRFRGRAHTVLVPAGQFRSLTVYGHLTHKATLHLSDTSGGNMALPITKSYGGKLPRTARPTLLSLPPSRSAPETTQTSGARSGHR